MYDSPLLLFFLARARNIDDESVMAINETRKTESCPTGPSESQAIEDAFLVVFLRKHLSK